VLFVISTGFIPFSDSNHVMELRYHWPRSRSFSSGMIDIVARIFQPSEKRIQMEELIAHPWLNDDGRLPLIQRHPLRLSDTAVNQSVVAKMVELGFAASDVTDAVLQDHHDQITTTYYLLDHHEKEKAEREERSQTKKAKHGSPSPSPSASPRPGSDMIASMRDSAKHCVIA
jgi:hypothetical protein